jgi:hypothetical protein
MFNDGIRFNGRRPCLYLLKGGVLKKFSGGNIPKYCVVIAKQHLANKDGVSVIYQINLANSVEALHYIPLGHKEWGVSFTSWKETAEYLGLTIEKTRRLLETEFKFTNERLNRLEEGLDVEPNPNLPQIVIFNIKKTTDNDKYWYTPKRKKSLDGQIVTIKPGGIPGPRWLWPEPRRRSDQIWSNWLDPIATTPNGAQVIFCRHRPGRYGGQYTIMVAVPSLI